MMEKMMSKSTFEEFKKKNEDYYKRMFEKNKKLFNTDVLFSNGKEISLEEAMLKGYQDECFFEDTLKEKKAS